MFELTTVHLRIEGMTCGACVARVRQAILTAPGVRDAQVNLATEAAVIEAESGVSFETLARLIKQSGYDAVEIRPEADLGIAHEREVDNQFRRHRQAVIQAVFMYALPVIALEFAGPALASTAPGSDVWWRALQALLCGIALLSPAGGPIIYGGIRALVYRAPNMDLLITLGVLAAFISSCVSIAIPGATHFHFHAAVLILAFINVGRYLEAKAKKGITDSIGALLRRVPQEAVRIEGDNTATVRVDEVRVGDHLRVLPDTQIPVDGRVIAGGGSVDESMVTGESIPLSKTVGDDVCGGSMLTDGVITIEATAVGAASAIGRIILAVRRAQSSRARVQRLADRVAAVFVPIVIALSLCTLIGWLMWGSAESGTWGRALEAAIAVMVIACPCAMGLATPTAVYVATARAAIKGVLVKDTAALEHLGRVDTVIFDKTGTLTTGDVRVSEVVDDLLDQSQRREHELLTLAASIEQFSQHPLARAIVARAQELGLNLDEPTEFENKPGFGALGFLGDSRVVVGSSDLLEDHGIDTQPLKERFHEIAERGHIAVWIARDESLIGLIGLADRPRERAAETVRALRALGTDVWLVTGDHPAPAKHVARALDIERVESQTRPAGKAELVRELQEGGHVVAFVGDGVNDAPAIAQADAGIAFAAGTDVANQAADLTLMNEDLSLVPEAIKLSRRTLRIIKQNLFWAFAYNALAIPLAAFGVIPAWVAPAAMMFSSISVVTNSLRLRSA